MSKFLELAPLSEALKTFIEHLPVSQPQIDLKPTVESLGDILMQDIVATEPLPPFTRSTVDGYAVIAADTYGASASLPTYLPVIGEVPMGASPDFQLKPQTCVIIHTGGMLPAGADAVVMIEDTQETRSQEIELYRSVAEGENTIEAGEDVQPGDRVLSKGTRLGPAELGGLLALGILQIKTARPIRVGILSSGDEVVEPEETPVLGQVRNINSYTLQALVHRCGAQPVLFGIIPDRLDAMRSSIYEAYQSCDMVVITAGSSASARDLTAQVIDELGSPGVLVHGVRIRPGKPTILAVCDGKPVIGLPGNPVSAIVIAGLVAVPVIEYLMGKAVPSLRPQLQARLQMNVPSVAGREDFVPVKLIVSEGETLAEPIFFKSNMIFSLAGADGLLYVPADAVGLEKDSIVTIYLTV